MQVTVGSTLNCEATCLDQDAQGGAAYKRFNACFGASADYRWRLRVVRFQGLTRARQCKVQRFNPQCPALQVLILLGHNHVMTS